MTTTLRSALAAAAAGSLLLGLAACGDRPQTIGGRAAKADTAAFQPASSAFVASGWKAGDETSWQAQLRTRAQAQNEYARSAPTAP